MIRIDEQTTTSCVEPQVLYSATVGHEYTVTKYSATRFILTTRPGSVREFDTEQAAKQAWAREVGEATGWQKFYSHSPLYTLEDCSNEHEQAGFILAQQAFEADLRWERESAYDAHAAWMT